MSHGFEKAVSNALVFGLSIVLDTSFYQVERRTGRRRTKPAYSATTNVQCKAFVSDACCFQLVLK